MGAGALRQRLENRNFRMLDILVPILGGVALTFVASGALCLLADARAEGSVTRRDDPAEPAPRPSHQRTDHPSPTM
jgi:hypothetical protein